MAPQIALIATILVAVATVLFFFGAMAALKGWMDQSTCWYLVVSGLIAIGACTAVVLGAMPFYEQD
jgi:multisubunit Na+/H+ antiporter MnhB subunit